MSSTTIHRPLKPHPYNAKPASNQGFFGFKKGFHIDAANAFFTTLPNPTLQQTL